MAGLKLDGAGQAKMKTLEEAIVIHQRIHGLVEKYALAVKRQTPTGTFFTNLKRQLPVLGGMLKGQFGMITDIVAATTLSISRGSSEPTRIRQMREGVGQIGQALDIAVKQVLEKHAVHDDKPAQPEHG
ncbi:MAG TPA: hypothetical protein VMV51_13015 [Gemmatimonadaceae bacterium]|nr:hypothetical protein [Gemmatimonadaceae bacterium]